MLNLVELNSPIKKNLSERSRLIVSKSTLLYNRQIFQTLNKKG